MFRIGQGYDVHALVAGRNLILGGVHVPYTKGLDGHSDADVLIHAICNACLGAVGFGDIGRHFPDSDATYKDSDSRALLHKVREMLTAQGWSLINLDSTIIAQAPRLAPYIPKMTANIAADLGVSVTSINIKATTAEKLGFIGREKGIAAQAVVLLTQ